MMGKYNRIMTTKKCSKLGNSWESLTTAMSLTKVSILLSSDKWSNLRIMQDMRESGLKTKMLDKEKEVKSGQMGLCMKDGGWITKPMAKED